MEEHTNFEKGKENNSTHNRAHNFFFNELIINEVVYFNINVYMTSSSSIISISICTFSILKIFKTIIYSGFENLKFNKYNSKVKISFEKRKFKM